MRNAHRCLSDNGIERLRDLYWKQVQTGLASELTKRVFVDKLPLSFSMNGAMYQLLRLGSAVAYYGKVMGLVQLCRDRLSLRFHAVRYEEVVTKFDGTIEKLLTFLDLKFDDNVRNYPETAKSRPIGTPSASQVVQPLYVSAIGKWRNYRRELEPHLAKLGPWVAAYGYEP